MKYLLILFCFVAQAQEWVNYKNFNVKYGDKGAEVCVYTLTREMVEKDTSIDRAKYGKFKRFKNISTSDYTNTNYDRGHLAPADAFSFDLESYIDTYNLSNIVPQDPRVNRTAWKFIEEYEKREAKAVGCVRVKIDVEYDSTKIKKLWIPKRITKTITECDGTFIGAYPFKNRLE